MRGNTLVTGGSDGSVRVWSLEKSALEKPLTACVHRLAAHDNSVTSLQFDENRIVSGGSDGRVKIWDLRTGMMVRELSTPADAVWRVGFEQDKAVILATRQGKTVMEVCIGKGFPLSHEFPFANAMQVWSFSPPPDTSSSYYRSLSPGYDSSKSDNGTYDAEPSTFRSSSAGMIDTLEDATMQDAESSAAAAERQAPRIVQDDTAGQMEM